ncbi:MAG: XRE family transcriptional regulator [Cytophagales bacterium]|nr:XRE family transcriptional regulator [Cytophagales bacterium]
MRQQEQINSQLIVLAREFRGLSQTALAESAGVTQSAIAQLEIGNAGAIGDDKFIKVAAALAFPIDFFYSAEPRLGFGSSSYFYRKKFTKASEKNYFSGIVNLSRIHLTEMLKYVEIDSIHKIPKATLNGDNSPEEIANLVKAAWNVPDGPIENLTVLMERAGVAIIEIPFGTSAIDGTSLWLNNLPPIVFVNSNLSPDRYRFTLAHELAHLVMHDFPTETMEKEADAFASEFLMPAQSFKTNLAAISDGRVGLKHLFQMKPYWKVSVAAMIMKLKQYGREKEYTSLNILMSKSGYRTTEPQPFQKEKPMLFRKVLEACLSNYHSVEAASEQMFNMFVDDFKRLYGAFLPAERPKLRLVVS